MTEQEVKKLIYHVLFWGVRLSAALMAIGLIIQFAGFPFGLKIIIAGIVTLVLTPAARLAMLSYGYAKSGEKRFAALAALVIAIMALGFFLK